MKSIQQFAEGLCRLGETDFSEPGVHTYLRDNPVEPASLEPYLLYTPTHYTRNLIYKCDLFELIMICWEIGQSSRIHNHSGQRCWMAAPIGRLAIQNYEVVRIDEPQGLCELRAANRIELDPRRPAYVDQERPVHAVLNLPEYAQRAASLHIYSRPYDRCLVYDLAKSSYCEVPLFYDTEYGRPVATPVS